MAEVTSGVLPRDELRKFLPNERAIRYFESLGQDVSQNIPENIDGALVVAAAAQAAADAAQAVADSAQATADAAVVLASDAQTDADEALEQATHLQLSRAPLPPVILPQDAQFILASRAFGR